MNSTLAWRLPGALFALAASISGQIIEFESNGLKFQTLTRSGMTVMCAAMPDHIRGYAIMQVAVQNGSGLTWTVRPEDFSFVREDGTVTIAVPARDVVSQMIEKAGRGDVIKLVTAYETGLYGNPRYRSTNGYEVRRQNALTEFGSNKLQAAAAASAIVFVATKLKSGESTDGAVFWPAAGKPLGAGKLIVKAAGAVFEFPML